MLRHQQSESDIVVSKQTNTSEVRCSKFYTAVIFQTNILILYCKLACLQQNSINLL